VHYSTDFVYDGERERPYDEFDPPSPQGLYARSKVAGEQLAAAATGRLFTLRVGCLYGRGGRNFPSTILRRLRAGETVRADRDRLGSPTWVVEVARVSAALARTPHFGLYHCTSQGETSWAAFASFMAAELELPASRVDPLPTSALPMKAPRPRRAILDNRMLRLRGLDGMSSWQDAARAFIKSES
jgi:dTDP-4-dehydrorhamnose reductase